MPAERVEAVAKKKQRVKKSVIKRLDAEMIAGAEKLAGVGVPDSEGKISAEVLDAVRAPVSVGVKK